MEKMVFIVDDSNASLMVAAKALESEFRVLTMPSAEKLFSLLERLKPDGILLDIEMPKINGFDAIARLKAHPEWSAIPVMFLTGWSDAALMVRALSAGALGVISKPFEPGALRDAVKWYLKDI